MWPRAYAFPIKYNRGTFYGDDGPIPDHNAKKALAKSMRHQWQQAETNYRKLLVV